MAGKQEPQKFPFFLHCAPPNQRLLTLLIYTPCYVRLLWGQKESPIYTWNSIYVYRHKLEDCLKCLDPINCNDVTIREGICTQDNLGQKYKNLLLPFNELEFTEMAKKFRTRWPNIESNLRSLYFQNAIMEYEQTGTFDFKFQYRWELLCYLFWHIS